MRRTSLVIAIICFLCVASGVFSSAHAEFIELDYSFDNLTESTESGISEFAFDDAIQYLRPGSYAIPMRTARVLLPPDTQVEAIEVIPGALAELDGFYELRVTPLPSPQWGGDASDSPVADGVSVRNDLPSDLHEFHSVQFFRGAGIALINLFPFQYDEAGKTVSFYRNFTLRVTIGPETQERDRLPYRGIPEDVEQIKIFVDNPGELEYFEPEVSAPKTTNPYVIITNDLMEDKMLEYADHINGFMGNPNYASVTNIQDIYNSYQGVDYPDEIRRFVRNRYENHFALFVLLAGDADLADVVIPRRGIYGYVNSSSGPVVDFQIPCDYYYSCLDGSWNYDGDATWGEHTDGSNGGDVDMFGDVEIGRLPIETIGQARRSTEKLIAHHNWIHTQRFLWLGEQLDDDPLTWGGDNKDTVWNLISGWGNLSLLPLYNRDRTFSNSATLNAMNGDSYRNINHSGHSSWRYWCGIRPDDIHYTGSVVTNDDPYFIFSDGCNFVAFDNSDGSGNYNADSVGEELVMNTEAGAYSIVSNSRYGWYWAGSTNGPGACYDREFWDAASSSASQKLGAMLRLSKMVNMANVGETGSFRWMIMSLNLLGCPATHPVYFTRCDNDGDGSPNVTCFGGDCHDGDSDINPGADEVCNGVDDNCDGNVDEGGAALCSDGISCTEDYCDGARGCRNEAINSRCNDGVNCTTDECITVIGCRNTPVNSACNDGYDCTDDVCSASSGCSNSPIHSRYDDNFTCTTDTCDPGKGQLATGCNFQPIHSRCADGFSCTDDSCDPANGQSGTGCYIQSLDSRCEDGLYCTDNTCDPATGDPATGCLLTLFHTRCEDNVDCTQNVCDPADGCTFLAQDDLCNDGVFCNGAEYCDTQDDCSPGEEPCPDDGLWCTGEEICHENEQTCKQVDVPCQEDGLFCNGDESCNESDKACVSAGDPCAADKTCNESANSCDDAGDDDAGDDTDDDANDTDDDTDNGDDDANNGTKDTDDDDDGGGSCGG